MDREPKSAGRTTNTDAMAPPSTDPAHDLSVSIDRARVHLARLESARREGDASTAAGASWMLRTILVSVGTLLDELDHEEFDAHVESVTDLTARAKPLLDSPASIAEMPKKGDVNTAPQPAAHGDGERADLARADLAGTSARPNHSADGTTLASIDESADAVPDRALLSDSSLVFDEPSSIAVETSCRQDPATKDIAELVKGVPVEVHADKPEAGKGLAAAALAHYLTVRSRDVWSALREYLYPAVWPKTSTRLEWNESLFNSILVGALEAGVELTERRLRELLHPHDVFAAIAPHVLAPQDKDLPGAVKLTLGQLFRAALGPSVARMTARYVDVADAMYAADQKSAAVVRREQIVASAPIDRFVANALTSGVARVAPDADVLTGKRKPPRVALRPVTLTFMGATNPALWFVVRAEPADATREEVAASLFAYAQQHGEVTSYYAYGLASVGALHALPASWAIQFPEARQYAPKAIKNGAVPEPGADSIGARLAVMASTDSADELALAQATHDANAANLSASQVGEVFDECAIQLEHVRRVLVAWELADSLIAEIGYVVDKRNHLTKLPSDQLPAWGAVALGQRERLYRIAAGLRSLEDAAARMGMADKRSSNAGPLREIVSRYATASSTSHLASTSEQLLAEAQQMQASLSLRSLQANVVALESAMEAGRAVAGSDKQMREQAHAYLETKDDARVLEGKLLNGSEVSAEDLERVELQAQELALQARLHTTQVQLDRLVGVWMSAGQGLISTIVATRKFNDIGPASVYIHAALGEIYNDLNAEEKQVKPVNGQTGGTIESARLDARRAALSRAQERFGHLQHDRDLAHFFNEAYDAVKSQQLRTAITHAALAIGIGIASAGVAGWVADGLIAAEGVGTVAELSMGARVAITATEVMGNAAGQTIAGAGQANATSFWGALADNAAFVLAPKMLGPAEENIQAARAFENMLAKQLATIEAQEMRAAAAMKVLAKTGRVLSWTTHQAGSITAHTIMGMAMGVVVAKGHQVVSGQANAHTAGGAALTQDLVIQGASVAVGKLVHGSVGERLPVLRQLAKRPDLAHTQELLADALALHQLAAEVSVHPDAKAALEVLHKRSALLEAELRVLDELATRESARPTQGGPSAREISAMRSDIKAQLGEVANQAMLDVQWRLLGLRELAPGVWSGTLRQVDTAIEEARRSGHDVEATGDQAEFSRRVRIDGKDVELHYATASARNPVPPEAERLLSSLKVVIEGEVYEGTEVQIQSLLENARKKGIKARRDSETGVWNLRVADRAFEVLVAGASESTRRRHASDPSREYQFNATRPGPLTDPAGAKGWDPAAGFFGGAYDEIMLDHDMLLYRVGPDGEGTKWGVGRWYTDKPLESEAQFRMDTAVKPVWKNKDGTVSTQEGVTRAKSPAEVSITVRAPKGTKIYMGPISPQSDIHLGGSGMIQYYVPDPRQLELKVVQPFRRDGHVQPPPSAKE